MSGESLAAFTRCFRLYRVPFTKVRRWSRGSAPRAITQPSPELSLRGPGVYEILGIAWSGLGRISKVEVSADGSQTWAMTVLSEPVLPKCFTRFRIPWRWNGGPAVLQSRAVDESGYVQPSRSAQIAARGDKGEYHCNAITSWAVTELGAIRHVYV
jgi:sulfane dehydrogenase subunit SoxC